MESPGESNQEGEDGTNERPPVAVSVSMIANSPRHEEGNTPSVLPDSSDLTGVGAVGEVVSGGDVRELTSKGNSKSLGGEESKPDEGPVTIGNLGSTGASKVSPEDKLPWDGKGKTEKYGLSSITLASD